jgi:ATP-binding cassette subfamily G (WHITE) protein 2 (PDR)
MPQIDCRRFGTSINPAASPPLQTTTRSAITKHLPLYLSSTGERQSMSSLMTSEVTTLASPGDLSDRQREDELCDIARSVSKASSLLGNDLLPCDEGSALDPWGSNFDVLLWTKAFQKLRSDADPNQRPRVSGIAFKNLRVSGFSSGSMSQETIGNMPWKLVNSVKAMLGIKQTKIDIIHEAEALVLPGEIVAVLGPPGSGCSTLLKTIAADTYGFSVDKDSIINYHGIRPEQIAREYRGDAVYTAEVDENFPKLTVGDTLYFAALARTPGTIPGGFTKEQYAMHLRDVVMKMFGISHTVNTIVGDNFVRGVSGGERKRVTIAEAALSFAPLQCWDNSTRGLDSANALEFCRALKTQAKYMDLSSLVAIYQASQDAYDVSAFSDKSDELVERPANIMTASRCLTKS